MRLLVVAVAGTIACTSSTLPLPVAKTRVGPADRDSIKRVVALPATCGSLFSFREAMAKPHDSTDRTTASGCSASYLDGVDALVRTLLEFRGFDIVDSETLNATTLARTEVETVTRSGRYSSESEHVERRGSRFADAPPALQDEILEDIDADAVLGVRVFVGAGTGISGRRTVDVLVRLHDFRESKLVWASRCEVEAGMVLNGDPIMEAARCAVEAAREL